MSGVRHRACAGPRFTGGLRRGARITGFVALAIGVILVDRVPVQATDAHGSAAAVWRAVFKRPDGTGQPLQPPAPAGNPQSAAKVALGARLFRDRRLSGNGQRACSTCHVPARQFSDGRRTAAALTGAPLSRNTPSLWNLAWSKAYFWDGRASSLEQQVADVIADRQEMAGEWLEILRRLNDDPSLRRPFVEAFPEMTAITREAVVAALASYVRSLISPRSRFDAWVDGDEGALSARELRGFGLFVGKAGCVLCHGGWRFTDDRLYDIGLGGETGATLAGVPKAPVAFKTPGLRGVTRTPPYMHDGSLPTLDAVLTHYSGGFSARRSVASSLQKDLRLTRVERADLVAFLETLSAPARPSPAER
jgi:cytochrome c peroxidase